MIRNKFLKAIAVSSILYTSALNASSVEGFFSDMELSQLSPQKRALLKATTLDSIEEPKLNEIATSHQGHMLFGKENNQNSLLNWFLHSRALETLKQRNINSAGIELEKEFKAKHRRLENIDFYAGTKDEISICRLGIQEQVATFDSEVRNKLILALLEANKTERANLWKSYNFDYSK